MPIDPISAFAIGYLHEDWQEDYSDFADVLASYIDETEHAEQIVLGKALTRLLDETQTEEETVRRLQEHDWQAFFEDVPPRMLIREISEALLTD